MTHKMIKKIIHQSGEVAIGTLIAIFAAVGGSYMFTYTRADTINNKLEKHVIEDNTKERLARLETKVDLLLKANGVALPNATSSISVK
jgi:hypothetical protein